MKAKEIHWKLTTDSLQVSDVADSDSDYESKIK
jgi:hypothetical protein